MNWARMLHPAADAAERAREAAARRVERTETGKRRAVVDLTEAAATSGSDDETGVPATAGAPVAAGVQCEGVTARGERCKVCSVGSSAPLFVSAPLRAGGRFCTTHAQGATRRRAAKKTATAAAGLAAAPYQPRVTRPRAVRAAAAARGVVGMGAAIVAAARRGE